MAAEIITKEDLDQFKKELFAELRELFPSNKAERGDSEWLRSAQVRKLLHISPGTLQNLRIHHHLPYTNIGSLFYYRRSDIEHLMESAK